MYLLDANVFIESYTRYYSNEVCPAFWSWLEEMGNEGLVSSVEPVRAELSGNSWLDDWVKVHPALFHPLDRGSMANLAVAIDWLHGQKYQPADLDAFLKGADSYLIAHAKSRGLKVVTIEAPARDQRNRSNKIKIPDVCRGLEVTCISPWRMLKAEGATFVLGQGRGRQPQYDR